MTTLAPSHHVASNTTTEDANFFSDPEPAAVQPATDRPDRPEQRPEQRSVLVPLHTLTRLTALTNAPAAADTAAQLAELQNLLRTILTARATGPAEPYREQLEAERAAHRTTKAQLEDLGLFTDSETQRAE